MEGRVKRQREKNAYISTCSSGKKDGGKKDKRERMSCCVEGNPTPPQSRRRKLNLNRCPQKIFLSRCEKLINHYSQSEAKTQVSL